MYLSRFLPTFHSQKLGDQNLFFFCYHSAFLIQVSTFAILSPLCIEGIICEGHQAVEFRYTWFLLFRKYKCIQWLFILDNQTIKESTVFYGTYIEGFRPFQRISGINLKEIAFYLCYERCMNIGFSVCTTQKIYGSIY